MNKITLLESITIPVEKKKDFKVHYGAKNDKNKILSSRLCENSN